MKKFLVVFGAILGMALVSGPLFAQANAVTLDVAPLAKGIITSDSDYDTAIFGIAASYERLLVPHFSLGLRMDLYAGRVGNDLTKSANLDGQKVVYFGLNAQGRVYPLSDSMDKLFIEAGLGFNTFSVTLDSDVKAAGYSADEFNFSGLTVDGKMGWRHVFGRMIFLEPSIGYVLAKSNSYAGFTPLGWQLGIGLGAAF
jgi:hypothetical protein